jgi:soluble lytic murein transglycosylase-like protein
MVSTCFGGRRAWARRGAAIACALCVVVYALTPTFASAQRGHVVVQDGDTLSGIAEAYGLTVQQLVWLNGIDDPDLIYPGERLLLSDASDGAVATTVAADDAANDSAVDSSDDTSATIADPEATPPYYDPETIREDLVIAADKWGWDPYLIMAIAWQESGWRQDEVSSVGAIGVMQVMPETAAELDSWLFQRNLDPWGDAWDNIDAGVAFLTCLYEEAGNDVDTAIASYYQGYGSIVRDGWFSDTDSYVASILALRDQFANGELP